MNFSTKIQVAWQLIKETIQTFANDRSHLLGAGIAYYALFSLAPLLVVVTGIAGFFYGKTAAQGRLITYVEQYTSHRAAVAIQDLVANAANTTTGIWATILGAVLLLVGAHVVFAQLQHSLNEIWGVPARSRGLWLMIRDRALSFLMVLVVGAFFLGTLVLTAVASWFESVMSYRLPEISLLLQIADVITSIGLVAVLVALVYKVLPDVEISWRDVWVGALTTALLLYGGKVLIAMYLRHAGFASTYGAAGSLVVVLVWVYYSAQIFLLGAEFTQVYAHRFGSAIEARRRGGPAEEAPAEGTRTPA